MKRLLTLVLFVGSITLYAQQKDKTPKADTKASASKKSPTHKLAGTWTLVLVDNILPDGSRVELYGPSPQGILMFDAQGNYSLQILRANRAKFAANDKGQGTPEEYKATHTLVNIPLMKALVR